MKPIKRRLRITNDPTKPLALRVEDADTGREIRGVQAIRYEANILSGTTELRVVAEVDVVLDAEIRIFKTAKFGQIEEVETDDGWDDAALYVHAAANKLAP